MKEVKKLKDEVKSLKEDVVSNAITKNKLYDLE